MKCLLSALVVFWLAAAGAGAQERLLVGRGDTASGSSMELIQLSNLATIAKAKAAREMLRDVVITRDRRRALFVQDVPPLSTTIPSVIVVDITKSTLPVVARMGYTTAAKRIALTPDGRTAVVAGFVNQWGNPPFPPELLLIDLTGAVPTLSRWQIPASQSAFGIALSAGGTHAYVVDNHSSQVVVVDLTKFPPVVATRLGVPYPKSVTVSPDGRRLLVPYMDGMAAIWDLTLPQAPARLPDLVLPGYFILDPPHFEPGSTFVVAETYMGKYPSAGMVYTVDVRGSSPTIVGSVGVGTASQTTTGNLVVTSDGLSAWRAMDPTSVLEEVDLTSPGNLKKTRTLLQAQRVWTMVSFGEMQAPLPTLVGTSFPIILASPGDAGKPFAMAASFSTRPGIPVGQRTIPLSLDALFGLSRTVSSVFVGFDGIINSKGEGISRIRTPSVPAFKGISFYAAGVVIDAGSPHGISRISNALRIVLQ